MRKGKTSRLASASQASVAAGVYQAVVGGGAADPASNDSSQRRCRRMPARARSRGRVEPLLQLQLLEHAGSLGRNTSEERRRRPGDDTGRTPGPAGDRGEREGQRSGGVRFFRGPAYPGGAGGPWPVPAEAAAICASASLCRE